MSRFADGINRVWSGSSTVAATWVCSRSPPGEVLYEATPWPQVGLTDAIQGVERQPRWLHTALLRQVQQLTYPSKVHTHRIAQVTWLTGGLTCVRMFVD